MSINKVLVTGGAGFIGSHLVDELIREGFEVTVLDNLSTGRIGNIKHHLEKKRFHFIEGDIRDRKNVEEALEDVEAVFHLASITSVPYSVKHPKITFEINVDCTRKLLEACLRNSVEKFIYVSTCAVYGEPRYLPVDEEHPANPISPYGVSKLKAEELCMKFSEESGLKVTVLRPFNIYGSRQRNDQYGGVISSFIGRLREGKPPIIYGDGEQTRDFIYVDDAVRAFILALSHDNAVGQIFNIATGVPVSINKTASLLIGMFGAKEVKPRYAGSREGDIRHIYADVEKAKIHFGFEPWVSLEEGLSILLREQVKNIEISTQFE